MVIRKAVQADLDGISALFSDIHTAEETGLVTIGWCRDVYPTERTAQAALDRGDLFVAEENGTLVGSAILNQQQVDVYDGADWSCDVPDGQVMVLHTLVISPRVLRKGYGQKFVAFYERYAAEHGCPCLRIDTNERNRNARALYAKLGYTEVDVKPCVFNGIEGVRLVLLEKCLTGKP